MFGKTLVLVAGAAGYVLGARAGRERYDQIKEQADRLMNNPAVHKAASDAQHVVAEKAPVVKDKVAGMVNTSDDSGSTSSNDLAGSASESAASGSSVKRASQSSRSNA